jgi:hypothetical protein
MTHHSTAGRKGGLSRSDKKLAAVRENGKRGGRPRYPVTVLHTFQFTPERELLRLNKDVVLRRRDDSNAKTTAFGIMGVTFRPASAQERLDHFLGEDFKHRNRLARELVRRLRLHKIWAKIKVRRNPRYVDADHADVHVLVRDRDWSRALALDIAQGAHHPREHNQSKLPESRGKLRKQ